MDYKTEKDFYFINYINSLSDSEKEIKVHGTFEVESNDKIRFDTVIHGTNTTRPYYYTINSPESLVDYTEEEFEFIETEKK
jgi:hypothetical protein